MSTPNYAVLVPQGRVKAHGVPWSEAEFASLIAIVKHYSYPTWREAAEYVRRGAHTVEDVEKLREQDAAFLKENGNKPVGAMTREELEERVRELSPNTTITKDAPKVVLQDEAAKAEAEAAAKAEAEAAATKKAKGDKKK